MDITAATAGLRVMDKVMTRTSRQRLAPRSTAASARPAHTPARPGTRPPTRRDPRRPGGPAPRAGTVAPQGSPGTLAPAPSAPSAARPPGARPDGPGGSPRALPGPLSSEPKTPTAGRQSARTGGTALPARTTPHRPPTVPAQAADPHRPVPQPRPTDLFADRLLLVLSGQRPVHWMLRHTAGQAYDELARLAERGPLRTRGARPVVRDIGYYVPRDGAVEAFARIAAGEQLRAMAFRLELGQDRRWRCTAVELGRRAGAGPSAR
ncbi:Rv3235 family protein [Streptomyces sp. NPDC006458]|uniref:Rv3235 family protein n=1 Tax=Streptomyces sp. NPDC006458 TaxID=3154302 RepID=UPI0033AC914B